MPEELPWLGAYGGQTIRELLALAGQYRVDSIVAAIEQALGRKAASLGYANLSNAERIVLAVEALEREVNNGGYGQFFENAAAYTSTIGEALDRIGCPTTAEITRKAIELTGNTEGEQLEDALDARDCEYYASGEDIAARLFAFIQSNPDDIIL